MNGRSSSRRSKNPSAEQEVNGRIVMGSYRKERIASSIRQIVSDAIAHKINDPRIDSMTTVTRVAVSGDGLIANVFLTVRGGSATERKTIGAIRHARGFVQRLVARQLPMRQCPELRFQIDDAVEGVRRTMELLAENRREKRESTESEGWECDDSAEPGGNDEQRSNECTDTSSES